MKLLTEFTTLVAWAVIIAICPADGLDGSAWTALVSASTDDLIALVWLGKSPLAELITAFASLWMVLSWDSKPLVPLLRFTLVSPLTESSSLVRSAQ